MEKPWSSLTNATVPVGVALPGGPVTVAVRVNVCPGVGLATLEVSATVGVSLLASAITVPPLAELPSQFASPPYDAVTGRMPAATLLNVTTASRFALPVVPKGVQAAVADFPPSVTVTLPVGRVP